MGNRAIILICVSILVTIGVGVSAVAQPGGAREVCFTKACCERAAREGRPTPDGCCPDGQKSCNCPEIHGSKCHRSCEFPTNCDGDRNPQYPCR